MEKWKCWYERTCKRQKEICNNLANCENCTRYLQMRLQTEMANMTNEFPTKLMCDQSQLDLQAFIEIKAIDIQDFVVNGKSLVIESENTGNGKTSAAKNLLLRYMAKKVGKINTGYFLSLPIALSEIKESIKTKESLPYKQIFSTVRLLVIDEVGYKKLSEYEETWLLRMLEERKRKPGLATIYTLNSTPELKELIGRRLYSRIYNSSKKIVLREKDKRGWTK